MKIQHLYEAMFGTNKDSYDNNKIEFITEKSSFAAISKVNEELYLIVMVYLDGQCLITSTDQPDVLQLIKSSTDEILKTSNIATALSYPMIVGNMVMRIVTEKYTKIDKLSFVSTSGTINNKLEMFLKRPDIMNYLESKRFEYKNYTTSNGYSFINFVKE